MRAGFIGLGNMGMPMARNLLKAGHELTVYNRTRSRSAELEPLGAKAAGTPGEAASDADALITMLADDSAVEEVMFAADGGINSLAAGAVHISMSTISIRLSRRLSEAHHRKGQHYIAAPVLGRPDAAEKAELFIIAAGPDQQIERCRALFDAMGQKTFHAGEEAPSANLMKITINFLLTSVIEGLAESFALIRKAGLDTNAFLDIVTQSVFPAPVYRNYGDIISREKFEPAGFRLALGLKDNRLLLAAAEEAQVPMPLAGLLHGRFLTALAHGLGGADWSAIARISYEEAGLQPTGAAR